MGRRQSPAISARHETRNCDVREEQDESDGEIHRVLSLICGAPLRAELYGIMCSSRHVSSPSLECLTQTILRSPQCGLN